MTTKRRYYEAVETTLIEETPYLTILVDIKDEEEQDGRRALNKDILIKRFKTT
ncbi:hypothetical protein CU098_013364 [Rhizopus stolonifer]|uniref:Uncharacterized protein n=1 Tax=Rhizopus stolonifer TaxID=4846 RepID=A0A367KV34_RHIST|nr:hypothetical protein CU098_013364 [Rhizopus stolonifer]